MRLVFHSDDLLSAFIIGGVQRSATSLTSVVSENSLLSPCLQLSRSSKKVHNFGKRSNSIKRNPNALVVKNGWLYKQDSTGMKMWKKRWFVLSDMCLFYYRDEKEEGILGSILLPSFRISMLSVDDHISRKYAFKVRDAFRISQTWPYFTYKCGLEEGR
uniref:PH domain-containing protein n=1 Tax=Sinocyclocheilus rhinocerous TaxID=307959 RepID=A0A673KZG3_9TELE